MIKKQSKTALTYFLSLCYTMLLFTISCDDIFEEDITDDEVFLLAPASGVLVMQDSTITFSWDFLDGATEYQIQIVSPSFDAASKLLLDSITTENKVGLSLPSGRYEWGVRGFNNGYSTIFFVNDFIVEDTVSEIPSIGDEINPLTPNGEINSENIFFWWDEVENATEYQLQIVSPNFDAPTELLYDTMISKAGVRLALQPGEYSWRVRARNEQSETDYQSLNFEVVSNAETPVIELLKPSESLKTNAIEVEFSWRTNEEVDFYILNVAGLIEENIITSNNVLSIPIDGGDKTYQWSVTALTNDQQTLFSDTLSFEYFEGLPAAPELVTPADDAVLSSDVNFEWSRTLDSILGDSLYVFDGEMNLYSGFPKYIQSESFQILQLPAGDYSWQLKSLDEDGRTGKASASRKFSIQ